VADLPADSPLIREFAGRRYVEAGWGDRAYYMDPHAGLLLGLRALLWPTPGVLHLVGLQAPPQAAFPEAEVVELRVSAPELARMHERVLRSLDPQSSGTLGPGLYGDSRFLASRERFHLLRTCNVWTAQVLREGGVPVRPALALTVGSLLGQLRPGAASALAQDGSSP
jgi:hypothetical protein